MIKLQVNAFLFPDRVHPILLLQASTNQFQNLQYWYLTLLQIHAILNIYQSLSSKINKNIKLYKIQGVVKIICSARRIQRTMKKI
jgi:hypothetical protein